MIDISEAQLDPFRAFHYFHEEINIHVKVSMAAALTLVRYAGSPNDTYGLSNLIKEAHPAWNNPPIHGLSIARQRSLYKSVASFALVSIFSAFDDFLIETEAELSRFLSKESEVDQPNMKAMDQATTKEVDSSDDDLTEKLINFYRRYKWDISKIDQFLPLISYFRLCRNCIAHRSSRVSPALSAHSKGLDLKKVAMLKLDCCSKELPKFEIDQEVFLSPTHAILCSSILRNIAVDSNKKLIGKLGLDGFIHAVAHHAMFSDESLFMNPNPKKPEAIFNIVATRRYRASLETHYDSIREMKRLNIWNKYLDTFNKKYTIWEKANLKGSKNVSVYNNSRNG